MKINKGAPVSLLFIPKFLGFSLLAIIMATTPLYAMESESDENVFLPRLAFWSPGQSCVEEEAAPENLATAPTLDNNPASIPPSHRPEEPMAITRADPIPAQAPAAQATLEKASKHVCSVCGKKCSYPSKLTRHMLSHPDKKPFKCDYPDCHYAGKTTEALKNHQSTHTGEKTSKCNYPNCKYASATSGNLKRHKKIHANTATNREYNAINQAAMAHNRRKKELPQNLLIDTTPPLDEQSSANKRREVIQSDPELQQLVSAAAEVIYTHLMQAERDVADINSITGALAPENTSLEYAPAQPDADQPQPAPAPEWLLSPSYELKELTSRENTFYLWQELEYQ